jgi:hypothetical protein
MDRRILRRLSNVHKSKPQQKTRGFVTGDFAKFNPKKYVGQLPITYRSSYELAFMFKMEANSNVKAWAAEQVIIPYLLKEKRGNEFVDVRHNYITDATVWLINDEKYICEIKPLAFTPLNESQLRNSYVHYKNGQKWKYAMLWCKQNGYTFKLITEETLKTKIF